MQDKVTIALQHPIVHQGKQSGQVLKQIDSVSCRPPNAGDYIALEHLMKARPIAFLVGLIQRLAGLGEADAAKLHMSDVRAIETALGEAGFFDSGDDEADQEAPAKSPQE